MNWSIKFGILSLILTAICACSQPSSVESELAPTEYDIEALLTRTDEIDVCTRTAASNYCDGYAGGLFKNTAIIRSSCECMRDGIQATIVEMGGGIDPVARNAFLQMAMNFEVQEVLFDRDIHPEGMTALKDYIAGENIFGMNEPELVTFMKEVKPAVDRVWGDDIKGAMRSFPSCQRTMDLYVANVPDWDPNTGADGFNELMVERGLDQCVEHSAKNVCKLF